MDNNMSASLKKLFGSFAKGIGKFMIPGEIQSRIDTELNEIGGSNDIVNHVEVEGIDLTNPDTQQLYKKLVETFIYK